MILLYILSGVGAVAIIFAIWFGIDNAIEEKIYEKTSNRFEKFEEQIERMNQELIYLMAKAKHEEK